MIIDKDGLKYEYVTFNNKVTTPASEPIMQRVSNFISQDLGLDYKFVVTFAESIKNTQARILVYKPLPQRGILHLLGEATVTLLSGASLADILCNPFQIPGEPQPSVESIYYVEDYYVEDYYV
jgi:hypothetical protein